MFDFFSSFSTEQRVSNGTKTMSIIDIMRLRTEGQIAAKTKELELREREIKLQEKKMEMEEKKAKDIEIRERELARREQQMNERINMPMGQPPVQYDRVEAWNLN